ncbi:MAG: hypothetical protein LC100_11775 [Chitinophagales bacterium]|nr:hypothetical protein [Chitinophagales bacterium]
MDLIHKEDIVFPVEIKIYKDNTIFSKMDLSFDEKYNITEIKEIDEDGKIEYSFTYKFDDKGNWVEQAMYEDGELEYITTRKIEY